MICEFFSFVFKIFSVLVFVKSLSSVVFISKFCFFDVVIAWAIFLFSRMKSLGK